MLDSIKGAGEDIVGLLSVGVRRSHSPTHINTSVLESFTIALPHSSYD